MQSQLQNAGFYLEIQTNYQSILKKVEELYLKFVPTTIRLRRSINQQKQPDTVIIATMIWGIMIGFPTQINTYNAACSFLYPDDFPSYSRYNRLLSNLL